jgi:large conductance mechanosensitive channel
MVPMRDLIAEFKAFVNRGNLIDLAIAVVLATAFTPVVASIVDGVLMQIIAAIFGQPNFDSIVISLGDTDLFVGRVITAIVNFLVVALVCFLIVKAYNRMKAETEETAAGPTEIDLLTEIRDELRSRGS